MSKTHKITLEHAIVGHTTVRELVFREPGWSDFMAIGPAYRWVPRGDGKVIPMPDHENIQRYAERCLVEPKDAIGTFAQMSLADSHKVVDLFVDFFLTAEMGAAASKTSSKTLSDTSTGDQPTSPT